MELRCIEDYAEPTVSSVLFFSRTIVGCTCGRHRRLCASDIQIQRGAQSAEREAENYPADTWESRELLPIQSSPQPKPQHSHGGLNIVPLDTHLRLWATNISPLFKYHRMGSKYIVQTRHMWQKLSHTDSHSYTSNLFLYLKTVTIWKGLPINIYCLHVAALKWKLPWDPWFSLLCLFFIMFLFFLSDLVCFLFVFCFDKKHLLKSSPSLKQETACIRKAAHQQFGVFL